MFPNLVTYHIHLQPALPPFDVTAYQYILTGNGLFIRADPPPISRPAFPSVTVRCGACHRSQPASGENPLSFPPAVTAILTDAGRERRLDGRLNEALYLLRLSAGKDTGCPSSAAGDANEGPERYPIR